MNPPPPYQSSYHPPYQPTPSIHPVNTPYHSLSQTDFAQNAQPQSNPVQPRRVECVGTVRLCGASLQALVGRGVRCKRWVKVRQFSVPEVVITPGATVTEGQGQGKAKGKGMFFTVGGGSAATAAAGVTANGSSGGGGMTTTAPSGK